MINQKKINQFEKQSGRGVEWDRRALDDLFSRSCEQLRPMVRLRMHARLKARFDASDVLQEVCCEATRRLPEYLSKPELPFFLWMRMLTSQKITALHRFHLNSKRRDPRREVPLRFSERADDDRNLPACRLISEEPGPIEELMREEFQLSMRRALNCLNPLDREIIALHHFELLTLAEIAAGLGIKNSAVIQRHGRALKKLKRIFVPHFTSS